MVIKFMSVYKVHTYKKKVHVHNVWADCMLIVWHQLNISLYDNVWDDLLWGNPI